LGIHCDNAPPPASSKSTEGREPAPSDPDTVSEEDYFDACLASSDLCELGLAIVRPWVGGQVYRAHRHLFRDYRAARSAVDFGQPQSAARLHQASSRLYEEASKVLANVSLQNVYFQR
jgi:hypothetical protein